MRIRWRTYNSRRRPTSLVGLALIVMITMALVPVSPSSGAPASGWGYIGVTDGTKLRYSLILPAGRGPFPAVLNYQGYRAGTDPGDGAWTNAVQDLVRRGYAVIGVNVRGTGCSSGDFRLFDVVQGRDGAEAVEWIARQPWSNGRVGMFGFSYGGIMQLLVAAQRPPHLKAISPGHVAVDLYRDVAMPGGIPNTLSLSGQSVFFERGKWESPTQAVADGDHACIEHQTGRRSHYTALQLGVEHPYWDDAWRVISPSAVLHRIRVPLLNVRAWQDEQVAARAGHMDDQLDPRMTWTLGMNGHHGMSAMVPAAREQTLRFFERYLFGVKNRWEQTPRLQLFHDVSSGSTPMPAWVTTHQRAPRVKIREFYAAEGGRLVAAPGPASTSGYRYPMPSPSAPGVFDPSGIAGRPEPGLGWQAPPTPGGSVSFDTLPLSSAVEVFGSASADLWISSTSHDTDVQVTVSEVARDGSETYVQRGWLRLSHRTLDESRSTRTRPFHTHLQSDSTLLKPGVPVLARVEILPVNHRFRAGSVIRTTIDAPTGHTGFYGFDFIKTPATISVHHGVPFPTRFVFGTIPTRTDAAAPPCGSLANQPCRGGFSAHRAVP